MQKIFYCFHIKGCVKERKIIWRVQKKGKNQGGKAWNEEKNPPFSGSYSTLVDILERYWHREFTFPLETFPSSPLFPHHTLTPRKWKKNVIFHHKPTPSTAMQVFTSLFSSSWRFECWSIDYKVTSNLNALVEFLLNTSRSWLIESANNNNLYPK